MTTRPASQGLKLRPEVLDGKKYGSTVIIRMVVPIRIPSIDDSWTARAYSIVRNNNTKVVSIPAPFNFVNVFSILCYLIESARSNSRSISDFPVC